MKEIILKYYLPVFGMTLLPILPVIAINFNSEEFFQMFLWLSILSFSLTLVLGTFQYKFGGRLKNKRQQKLIKNELFQQFIYKGFTDNEVSISGYFKNYFIIISPEKEEFSERKWLEIVILFNPKQHNQFIPSHIFKKLYKLKRKDYNWNSNSLTIKKVYGFKLPKYNNVRTILEIAIDDLEISNIIPIGLREWKLLINESVNHYNQVSTLNK